ncbi:bile acid:sodium symporter family protein [Namhaeicola litoreus]|uniref:Bile acid:sodium symporter family protein n=1 Tax=Namhaeicola litoreus TaxID=1052145 RepID=A0ABW3Y163_9FLAO
MHIDDIRINFNADNLWLVNFALALVMFGVALDIKVSDFTSLFRSPKPVIIGIVTQFILIPLVSFLFILVIQPQASVALGIMMVAACPGGNVSNFMTKMAGGNTALSVSLTAFATLAALIMTPLNFALYGNLYAPTAEILKSVSLNPLEVTKLVLLILGIPLFFGVLINHYKPKLSKKTSKILKPVSVIIFLSFIIIAFLNNFEIFIKHVHLVLFIVLGHNAILLLTGYLSARFGGLDYVDQKTISIESGIQNSGLGLMLVFTFFDGLGGMALLVAFWAIWDIVSGLLVAFLWSDKRVKTAKA